MSFRLFFVLLISVIGFSQEINQFDVQGKRHGLWKGIYEKTKRPRYEGTFNHGKETGIFKYFDDTKAGTVIATRDFSKGDGSCYTIFFNQKGKKVSEGVLKNKLPEGEWKYYHLDSDQYMTLENYKKGKLDGVKKVFYKDGTLAEESMYSNGDLNGYYKKYAENGKPLEDSNYKNGEFHGPALYYDGAGNLVFKGQYKNGRKSGYWETYEEGKLVKKEKITPYTRKVFKKDSPAEFETKYDKK
jgi:antitoxin component YwqK of YwqJK toxin-antitoxin module